MTGPTTDINRGFVIRTLIKAGGLFLLLNLLFALTNPLPIIGRLSIYNTLVPGRHRLPFGENPEAYNLSLLQLDAMFASHEVAVPKTPDEYRVFVIGDSSVWGILLQPDETLAAFLTTGNYLAADGRSVCAYNLGYPTISVSKDLLLLSYAMQYEPDMIIWLVTLEAMPTTKQLSSPIVSHNPQPMRELIVAYGLNIPANDSGFVTDTLWDRTIVGQRRALADIIRLNAYGIMWASSGIDQFYPDTYTPRAEDLPPDDDFYGLAEPLRETDLSLEILRAGVEIADDVPVIFINEPMFVSDGENSDIRYNYYYPRWAYDEYRAVMAHTARRYNWTYLDLWDAIPASEFTNSAIHLTPTGSSQLADLIASYIGWDIQLR
jgi:hypothetical protein